MSSAVMVSVNADNSRLETAQVAFKDQTTWMIMGQSWRMSGLSTFAQMPSNIHCPVVDLSPIEDDKALQHAMSAHTGGSGVVDLPGLIARLVEMGALVS
jgi:hypothetical protein